jgi:hypothetical protein
MLNNFLRILLIHMDTLDPNFNFIYIEFHNQHLYDYHGKSNNNLLYFEKV